MIHPTELIRGAFVALGEFTVSDITDDYVGWLNDPIVVRFSNQRFKRHSIESCLAYHSTFANTPSLFLKIISLDSGKAIGTMTAHRSTAHGTADMGLLIGNSAYWQKGVGKEAWNLLLNWLISEAGVRKVTGGCMAPNVPMTRIMKSSGMRLEAVRRGQEVLDGVPQDLLYFAKFRDSV